MSTISSDYFVTDILNSMSTILTDEQLSNLKNLLYIKLHNIQLVKQNFELAPTISDDDILKLEYFRISKKLTKHAEGTIKQYIHSVSKLRDFVGKDFKDINTMDIEWYISTKQTKGEWGDVSTENELNYMNVFFKFLIDKGFISKNPIKGIEHVKVTDKIKTPYTVTEIEKLKSACEGDLRLLTIVEFLSSTALRIGSVSKLKWGDLDFEKKTGYAHVKGGDVKKFRFNEKTLYYLLLYRDERMKKEGRTANEMNDRHLFVNIRKNGKTNDYEGLSCERIRKLLDAAAIKAGVQDVYPHKFRRTFACNAIAHGMPMEEVKEHLMHKNIETTFVYARITDEKLEQSYRTYCE